MLATLSSLVPAEDLADSILLGHQKSTKCKVATSKRRITKHFASSKGYRAVSVSSIAAGVPAAGLITCLFQAISSLGCLSHLVGLQTEQSSRKGEAGVRGGKLVHPAPPCASLSSPACVNPGCGLAPNKRVCRGSQGHLIQRHWKSDFLLVLHKGLLIRADRA